MAFRAERRGFHDTDKAVGIGRRTALEGCGRTVVSARVSCYKLSLCKHYQKDHATIGAELCKMGCMRSAAPLLPSCWSPFSKGKCPSQGTTSS
jgi:hypothetical protein